MRALAFSFVALLVLTVCAYAVGDQPTMSTARVIKVIDGDTYLVESLDLPAGRLTKIRPYLVSCPEIDKTPPECYAAEAEQYCWNLLLGRCVWIVDYGRRSGDRLMAFVYLDPQRTVLLQTLLVAQGLARADVRHPEEEAMRAVIEAAESWAREHLIGLWGACPESLEPIP